MGQDGVSIEKTGGQPQAPAEVSELKQPFNGTGQAEAGGVLRSLDLGEPVIEKPQDQTGAEPAGRIEQAIFTNRIPPEIVLHDLEEGEFEAEDSVKQERTADTIPPIAGGSGEVVPSVEKTEVAETQGSVIDQERLLAKTEGALASLNGNVHVSREDLAKLVTEKVLNAQDLIHGDPNSVFMRNNVGEIIIKPDGSLVIPNFSQESDRAGAVSDFAATEAAVSYLYNTPSSFVDSLPPEAFRFDNPDLTDLSQQIDENGIVVHIPGAKEDQMRTRFFRIPGQQLDADRNRIPDFNQKILVVQDNALNDGSTRRIYTVTTPEVLSRNMETLLKTQTDRGEAAIAGKPVEQTEPEPTLEELNRSPLEGEFREMSDEELRVSQAKSASEAPDSAGAPLTPDTGGAGAGKGGDSGRTVAGGPQEPEGDREPNVEKKVLDPMEARRAMIEPVLNRLREKFPNTPAGRLAYEIRLTDDEINRIKSFLEDSLGELGSSSQIKELHKLIDQNYNNTAFKFAATFGDHVREDPNITQPVVVDLKEGPRIMVPSELYKLWTIQNKLRIAQSIITDYTTKPLDGHSHNKAYGFFVEEFARDIEAGLSDELKPLNRSSETGEEQVGESLSSQPGIGGAGEGGGKPEGPEPAHDSAPVPSEPPGPAGAPLTPDTGGAGGGDKGRDGDKTATGSPDEPDGDGQQGHDEPKPAEPALASEPTAEEKARAEELKRLQESAKPVIDEIDNLNSKQGVLFVNAETRFFAIKAVEAGKGDQAMTDLQIEQAVLDDLKDSGLTPETVKAIKDYYSILQQAETSNHTQAIIEFMSHTVIEKESAQMEAKAISRIPDKFKTDPLKAESYKQIWLIKYRANKTTVRKRVKDASDEELKEVDRETTETYNKNIYWAREQVEGYDQAEKKWKPKNIHNIITEDETYKKILDQVKNEEIKSGKDKDKLDMQRVQKEALSRFMLEPSVWKDTVLQRVAQGEASAYKALKELNPKGTRIVRDAEQKFLTTRIKESLKGEEGKREDEIAAEVISNALGKSGLTEKEGNQIRKVFYQYKDVLSEAASGGSDEQKIQLVDSIMNRVVEIHSSKIRKEYLLLALFILIGAYAFSVKAVSTVNVQGGQQ